MTIERYRSRFPLPSPHERELLVIFMEECNEAAQRAAKMLRFGRDEYYDDRPDRMNDTNKRMLSIEIGQMQYMIDRLLFFGLVDPGTLVEGYKGKPAKLQKYMQTDPDGGTDNAR